MSPASAALVLVDDVRRQMLDVCMLSRVDAAWYFRSDAQADPRLGFPLMSTVGVFGTVGFAWSVKTTLAGTGTSAARRYRRRDRFVPRHGVIGSSLDRGRSRRRHARAEPTPTFGFPPDRDAPVSTSEASSCRAESRRARTRARVARLVGGIHVEWRVHACRARAVAGARGREGVELSEEGVEGVEPREPLLKYVPWVRVARRRVGDFCFIPESRCTFRCMQEEGCPWPASSTTRSRRPTTRISSGLCAMGP